MEEKEEPQTQPDAESKILDCSLREFMELAEKEPVSNYAAIRAVLAVGMGKLTAAAAATQDSLHVMEKEKTFSMADSDCLEKLALLMNIQAQMTLLSCKGDAISYFDYLKMPECFKQ